MATVRRVLCSTYDSKILLLNPRSGVTGGRVNVAHAMKGVTQLCEDEIAMAHDTWVSIWRYPEMSIRCQSKGHTGSVNGMAVDAARGVLFTASDVCYVGLVLPLNRFTRRTALWACGRCLRAFPRER